MPATYSTKKRDLYKMVTAVKKAPPSRKLSEMYKDFAKYVTEMITGLQEKGRLQRSLARGERVKILANMTKMHDKLCKAFKEKYPEGLMPLTNVQRFYQEVIFPKVFIVVGASPRISARY